MLPEQSDEYDDLRSKLSVHIHKLQEDAETQAELAFRAGELAAGLKAESRRARLRVDEAIAKADRAIRANPESFGL